MERCPSGRRCLTRNQVWLIATVGSNPTLSASKIKASEHFAWKPFSVLFLFLTSFLTSWQLSTIFLFTLDHFFGDALLHLLCVVHIAIHREGGRSVTEPYLYLLRADLLLSEERCVRVPEGMKA